MNRLAELLGHFSLPDLTKLLKRTMYSALVIGGVALIVSGIVGYVLVGLGIAIGLGLGTANCRVLVRQASDAGESDSLHPVRVLASKSALRLGAITGVALLLLVASLQLGLGAIVGMLVFNFGFLANCLTLIFRKGTVA